MSNLYRFILVGLLVLPFLISCTDESPAFIDNNYIFINLGSENGGAPIITSIQWKDKKTVLKNLSDKKATLGWVSQLTGLHGRQPQCTGWNVSEDSLYYRAVSGFYAKPFYVEFHVNLLKDSPHFSCYYTFKNEGATDAKISQFPVFYGNWQWSGDRPVLKWWDALLYRPNSDTVSSDTNVTLQSRMYSSDNYNHIQGNLPYWQLQNSMGNIYFGLAWCGGWTTQITSGQNNTLQINVFLPTNETQLTVKPGEAISGPELFVSPIAISNEMVARAKWFEVRSALAQKTYGHKPLNCPLIYNHWYAAKSEISGSFLRDQINLLADYGFDAFVVDDGWYRSIGDWMPNSGKFADGELPTVMTLAKSKGCFAGLWSCPQLKSEMAGAAPNDFDSPGRYVPYLDARLLDYTGSDFSKLLDYHLDTLSQDLKANWWKYDQDFFALETRQGKMKSVLAMQSAFDISRRLHPSLVIESCMGGGKMINEFTDAIAQIHWLKDGGRTGYLHALTNLSEAIGATGFLEPQKAERWTNRIDEIDALNPEILKFYCRSCMLGTWGISTDLKKITARQKAIVLKEISNYRKLNELKKYNLYGHEFPREYSNIIQAAYYNNDFTRAGVLLYRMFPGNETDAYKLQLQLNTDKVYRVTNADDGSVFEVSGGKMTGGFVVSLGAQQLSALYFIEAL